jgi:hypothetical protein
MGSNENLDKSHNYSEEDFMVCYCNVFNNSEDTWRSGLKLHNDEHIIPSTVSSHYASNRHQVYAIINDTSEEFDAENNPIINLQNPHEEPIIEQKEKQSQPSQQGTKFSFKW